MKISPTAPELEPLVPSGVRVCGRVAPMPSSQDIRVQVRPAASSQQPFTLTVPRDSGHFCEFLPPGKYVLSVLLPGGHVDSGLQ